MSLAGPESTLDHDRAFAVAVRGRPRPPSRPPDPSPHPPDPPVAPHAHRGGTCDPKQQTETRRERSRHAKNDPFARPRRGDRRDTRRTGSGRRVHDAAPSGGRVQLGHDERPRTDPREHRQREDHAGTRSGSGDRERDPLRPRRMSEASMDRSTGAAGRWSRRPWSAFHRRGDLESTLKRRGPIEDLTRGCVGARGSEAEDAEACMQTPRR